MRLDAIQAYLTGFNSHIDLPFFLLDMGLTVVCALILGQLYIRFGSSLSNRRRLANNFIMLALTTMMIISVIKTSLALSLGLVGALSIVRFRSAIKEPEELAFIFMTVALGLGFGADQRDITLAFFVVICLVLLARFKLVKAGTQETVYLSISDKDLPDLTKILEELSGFGRGLSVRRMDKNQKEDELLVSYTYLDREEIPQILEHLETKLPKAQISLVNDHGIFQ